MSQVEWLLVAAAVLLLIVAHWRRPRKKAAPAAGLTQAKRRFHAQRERLEAKFVQLAAARNKSDAQRWDDCTFADDVAYVRNRATGELSAFVAMTVAAEACNGSSGGSTKMIGNLQAGTAIFRFDCDHWVTDGRAILNLNLEEALRYYQNDLEIVDAELAQQA